MKKAAVLLFCLALAVLLPLSALAKVPTEMEAYNSMIALKADYPEGKPWTNDDYYAWHGGIFNIGYGCAGFVFLLSDAAFGTLPAREYTEIDYDALRVGDILRIYDNTHSVIILKKYSDHVVLAEGNFNYSIHWGRTLSKSDVLAADYYLTRYPLPTHPLPTHTITFNGNGADNTMEAQTVNDDEPTALNANILVREGYTFKGWNTNAWGTGQSYADQETVTLNDDLNLYAQWERITCTLSYDANGGEGSMEAQTAYYGNMVYLPSCGFTREGYEFDGWNTAADGSGDSYNLVDLLVVREDMKFYAQWKRINRIISFNANGGEGEMEDQVVFAGESCTLRANTFVLKGYYFSGWNTSSYGNGTAYKDQEEITPAQSMTLYAQWLPILRHITYDPNGAEGSPYSIDVYDEELIYLEYNWYSRPGYTFSGWNTAADGSGTAYQANDAVSADSDMTFYAQWLQMTRTVHFDANGGSGQMEDVEVIYGETYTLPDCAFTAPAGYVFDGWDLGDPGKEIVVFDDLWLTAQWRKKTESDPGPDDSQPEEITQSGTVVTANPGTQTAVVSGVADPGAATVTIPATVTASDGTVCKVTEIAENAFKSMKKLKKVTIGKNIAVIGSNAFNGCVKLKTVSGGAGIVTIGEGAFQKCKALTEFTIGKKVKKIGKNAFNGCSKLKTITVKSTKLTKKTLGKGCFKDISKKAVFKVPKKQKKLYSKIFVQVGKAPEKAKFK